jgi:hypothetical protein
MTVEAVPTNFLLRGSSTSSPKFPVQFAPTKKSRPWRKGLGYIFTSTSAET